MQTTSHSYLSGLNANKVQAISNSVIGKSTKLWEQESKRVLKLVLSLIWIMILGQWIFGGRTLSGETKTRMAFHYSSVTPFKKTLLPKPKEGHFSRLLDGSNKANLGIFPSKENKTETLLKILKETFLPKIFYLSLKTAFQVEFC